MTDQVDFGGLSIAFDDRVLRPRSWTLAQSLWAAELLATTSPGPLLELCAGAGQIGLRTVLDSPRPLVMVDLDEHACSFARRNAEALSAHCPVEVRQGDMAEVVAEQERFAAVLADPPWVRRDDTSRFPEDPLTAIDGGEEGLDLAWRCLEVAAAHVDPDGWVLLQVGTTDQVTALEKRIADEGLALTVSEVREHGDRGVLALLRPATATATA